VTYTLDILVREEKLHGKPSEGTVHVSLDGLPSPATIEPVQVKPFGAQFNVGSCAYHWINDYSTLNFGLHHGKSIEFRYVTDVDDLMREVE